MYVRFDDIYFDYTSRAYKNIDDESEIEIFMFVASCS